MSVQYIRLNTFKLRRGMTPAESYLECFPDIAIYSIMYKNPTIRPSNDLDFQGLIEWEKRTICFTPDYTTVLGVWLEDGSLASLVVANRERLTPETLRGRR